MDAAHTHNPLIISAMRRFAAVCVVEPPSPPAPARARDAPLAGAIGDLLRWPPALGATTRNFLPLSFGEALTVPAD